jgi:hypothetical protein
MGYHPDSLALECRVGVLVAASLKRLLRRLAIEWDVLTLGKRFEALIKEPWTPNIGNPEALLI